MRTDLAAESPEQQQLTTKVVAAILDLSEVRVRQLANEGRLRCTRTTTGLRLFQRADVEQLANARRIASAGKLRRGRPRGSRRKAPAAPRCMREEA